ncbi:hypothetical protein BRARA_B02463 [Brassica rapa]|uniref:DUF659 domain-containing protein n=1 Tax=Brassica campestris TaxID=3711 RepID=A0A398ACD7_BRACM|nr:hypothetical protein BRARA_B02463 [Brassica rapa]
MNPSDDAVVDDKAPLWIYVNKIEKIAGGGSWRFECKFCSNTYVGSYTRVKLVNDCKERIKHAASTPVPLPSSSRKTFVSSLDYDMSYKFPDTSEFESKKRKGMGSALEKAFNNQATEQCDGEIFRMFYTSGLSFNVARNPHYRNSYVRASQIPGYVPPGYNALRTTLLQKERKNIELAYVVDGWSDPHRRPILNLIAANESGPMMLRAVNTQGEAKTGEVIVEMIIECIKEVGHENVVQILIDNASNCVKAGALISAKFPTIFWTPCVVHTFNLALKNICAPVYNTRSNEEVYDACYWIKSISEDATWIKNFIMNHGMRLVMFTEHCDLKLLRIASTSPKWDDYKDDGVERASSVKKKILDEMFWDEIDYALSFTLPIYNVIRAADTDKPSLHLVYEWWESMIQTVKKSILTSRWSKSNTPLHCMAHSLNPKYYSSEWLGEENSRKGPHQDLEITRKRKNCIMKYFLNQDERREVNIEYSNFSLSLEDFGSVYAIHDRFILEPLRWNWSTYKFIHSATRNKIMPQRAEDLVFVHINIRLLSRRSSAYKEGPNKMWDVGGYVARNRRRSYDSRSGIGSRNGIAQNRLESHGNHDS